MRVYIAGPLSGPTATQQRANCLKAIDWMLWLLRHGHTPFCPHLSLWADEEAAAGEGAIDYEVWMRWALRWLEQCEVLVYLGPSPGADRELARARELGMPVVFVSDEHVFEAEMALLQMRREG